MMQIILDETMSIDDKKASLESGYAIRMTDQFRKELTDMCNISQTIERRGERKEERKEEKASLRILS